jgi:hypothetical protein
MDGETKASFTQAVLDAKLAFEQSSAAFVADRTSVDSAAFWLHWVSPHMDDATRTQRFLETCRSHATSTYTHIVFAPWGAIDLVDDSIRTADPYYQYEMSCLMKGILSDWGIRYLELPPALASLDERISCCLQLVGQASVE